MVLEIGISKIKELQYGIAGKTHPTPKDPATAGIRGRGILPVKIPEPSR
jgi:hypothetical protein